MIIDLHSHYPMHIAAADGTAVAAMLKNKGTSLSDRLRAFVLLVACKLADYEGKHDTAGVTLETLAASNVRGVLSVLYVPWDEMDLGVKYGSAPRPRYFADLLRLIDQVESSLQGQQEVVLARSLADVDAAMLANRVALVHAVEGGFHLGDSVVEVERNIAELAARGVAYITLAHLFWRTVATNAPALPFLADVIYKKLFPQPDSGVSALGEAAIHAMVANRILVDVTHMSDKSFADTMRILDVADAAGTVPVIASHGACRLGGYAYNMTDGQIDSIAARNGVIGLIACEHYMAKGLKTPKNFHDSVDVVCHHIDRIYQQTGSYDHIALGSDHDGFIKPSLPGMETPVGLGKIEVELVGRYGAAAAAQICSGNARRVLAYWR